MTDPHAADAADAPSHDAPDHGHDDAHGQGDESLGPIDVAAWGAGIVGIAISILIAACFVLGTSGIG